MKMLLYISRVLIIITAMLSKPAVADNPQPTADDVNALEYISCETGYISDMITYGNPQTCIDTPILNKVFIALATAGQSIMITSRMKMNHEELYPGNCKRQNRADYWDPKITFGMCNNFKLITANVGQLIKSAGKDPFPPLRDYIIEYRDAKPSDGVIAYADFPAALGILKVDVKQDQICVDMMSLAGFRPIGCKYIKEPFPKSIFETTNQEQATSGNDLSQCNSTYNCSEKARLASKTIAPILSPIISCVREMILRLVISTEVCNPSKINQTTKENLGRAFALGMENGSMINKFQRNMQGLVSTFLTLYVIMFGFKVAMGGPQIKTKDMINFVIKFILVTYFSVGINMGSGSDLQRFDGMTQIVFPILLNGVTEVASWMMASASINGLCSFPSSIYPAGSDISMSLWDQIDCRLANYIGYDALLELILSQSYDTLMHPIPPYVFFLVPALILGNAQLIMLTLMYPIMIVSFVAYSLCMFVSSLILILILGILAPIFVPLALFSYTKSYFDKWWKSLLSLLIQPAISIAFMSLMFAVYDRAFYGTCIYRSVNLSVNLNGDEKEYRSFYISTDDRDYAGPEEINSCTGSLGYFLNNPVSSMFGSVGNQSLNSVGQAAGTIQINPQDPGLQEHIPQKDTDYLNGKESPKLQWTNGLFTQSPKMFWEELVSMIKNLILCFIMLTVLKHLMNSITQFVMALAGEQFSAGGVFDPGQIQKVINDKVGQAAGSAAKGVAQMKEKMQAASKAAASAKSGDAVSGSGGGAAGGSGSAGGGGSAGGASAGGGA